MPGAKQIILRAEHVPSAEQHVGAGATACVQPRRAACGQPEMVAGQLSPVDLRLQARRLHRGRNPRMVAMHRRH